jgi:hypothetical protein
MSLINAVKNNDIELVKKLINGGIDPSFLFNEPLLIAAGSGHIEIVKFLLKDSRININDPEPDFIPNIYTALDMATKYGHLKIVDYLLTDPKIGYIDRGFFHALRHGHAKIIERYHEEPLIGFSKNIQTVPKKMFFIKTLKVPEELNDVILHYLFKNPSIFPDYVPNSVPNKIPNIVPNKIPNNGSCCIS